MENDLQTKLLKEAKPQIEVIKNRYMSAKYIVIEELTKKTWLLPLV